MLLYAYKCCYLHFKRAALIRLFDLNDVMILRSQCLMNELCAPTGQ